MATPFFGRRSATRARLSARGGICEYSSSHALMLHRHDHDCNYYNCNCGCQTSRGSEHCSAGTVEKWISFFSKLSCNDPNLNHNSGTQSVSCSDDWIWYTSPCSRCSFCVCLRQTGCKQLVQRSTYGLFNTGATLLSVSLFTVGHFVPYTHRFFAFWSLHSGVV